MGIDINAAVGNAMSSRPVERSPSPSDAAREAAKVRQQERAQQASEQDKKRVDVRQDVKPPEPQRPPPPTDRARGRQLDISV